MATNTTNYGWTKPSYEDAADIEVINDTIDNIDAQVKTVETALNSKQNALSSAQLDAVNSGIDSTKVAQIETNKNNISYNTNNGVKNILDFVNLSKVGGSATVVKDDDSIAVTSIAASWSNVAYKPPILPAGTYTFSALISNYNVSGGAARIIVAKTIGGQQEVGGKTFNANGKINFNFISDGEQLYLLYYPNYSKGSYVNSFTASQNMLCTKAAWDISQTYQPYAMSNAELTAKEQQNENNILSIDAIIGKQVYSAFLGRDSGTVQYQMKTNDFQTDTPDTQQCGIYIVYVISWSTTPVVSIYTVGYSGGTTGYNAATKIVGTDNLISVDENRKITYTGNGKISIYAMR